MFKNCRKEDLRIVALELGKTVAEKVTTVELTEIIKENKYFKEDVEFVKELIQYTIQNRKRVEEDHNERTCEGGNSLDAWVKSVRILTVKVPNRPEVWAFFFASLERAFVSKNVPEKFKSEILLNLLGEKASNVLTYVTDDELVAAVAEWYRYRIVACLVTSSSSVPLKTRREGQRCTLNLSRAETSSRWCGVVVRRGGASSGVVHVT
ncbi:integrase catalytic domain-containing protein [Trichonephila clavipes]|nr:integrase catalytic domain-containing protein [Trichonephila clavipes]